MKKFPLFVLLFLCTGLFQCSKNTSNDVAPGSDVQTLSDPTEISKVVVIPGATLETGTPPPSTPTKAGTPVLSTPTPELSTISGQEATLTLNYSNAVGGINYIYVQFDGASVYFKIPIANSGTAGTIKIPVRVPEKVELANFKCYSMTTFATTYNGACRELTRGNCLSASLPPRPGKSKVSIGGKSYDGTAACDLNFGQFGRGYGILINDSQFVVLYNMRQGNNQLGDFEAMASNSGSGVPSSPFALYFDGTTIYYSTSGTATAGGKTVSTSVTLKELTGSRRISVSATGNCQ